MTQIISILKSFGKQNMRKNLIGQNHLLIYITMLQQKILSKELQKDLIVSNT